MNGFILGNALTDICPLITQKGVGPELNPELGPWECNTCIFFLFEKSSNGSQRKEHTVGGKGRLGLST